MHNPNKENRLNVQAAFEQWLKKAETQKPINSADDVLAVLKAFVIDGQPFFTKEDLADVQLLVKELARKQGRHYHRFAATLGRIKIAMRYSIHAEPGDPLLAIFIDKS